MLCQSKYTLFIAWADALGHAAMQRHPIAAAPRAHALSAMGLGGGLAQAPLQPLHTLGHNARIRPQSASPPLALSGAGGKGWTCTRSRRRMKTLEVLWGKRREGQREAEKRLSPDAFQ